MVSPSTIEATVELGLLGFLALQAARILAHPTSRRELRGHPFLALALPLGAASAVATVLWAALASTVALRALTAAALLIWSGYAWRSRTTYGSWKGLPPGSLSVRASLDAVVDRGFYLRQVERHGPIFKMAQFHRSVVCVLGLERGREVLRTYRRELTPPPLPLSALIPRGFLRYMAPTDHKVYAPLFRAAFDEAMFEANRAFIRKRLEERLHHLSRRSLTATEGLRPRETIDAFLTEVLARVFFGSLLTRSDLQTVESCIQDGDLANATGRASTRSRRSLDRFSSLILERNASNGAAAGPCVWSRLLELQPLAAEDRTVTGNLFALLMASHDSIGNLLDWVLKLLCENQIWIARLRDATPEAIDEPGRGSADSDLATRVVLETLRLSTSEYVYRHVVEPIEIDGFSIPKGWMLRILVAESHQLDPPFERPFDFDPDRHLDRNFSPDELSPFGLDHHVCMGASLTLFLARLFTEGLSHYDWTVRNDGPPERGNRHWMHWAPNARFRVVLSPGKTNEVPN